MEVYRYTSMYSGIPPHIINPLALCGGIMSLYLKVILTRDFIMRFLETQIITLANQKGGCGKTSSTVSLAAAFAELGYSACILDTDPQCNATETFGVTQDQLKKEGKYTLADIYLSKRKASDCLVDFDDRFGGRLGLVPGHRGLNTVAPRLDSEIQTRIANEEQSILDIDDLRSEHRLRLKNSLESLRGRFDVVLIDTPPDLGFLMTTALIASDWFVIPVFPSGYDLKGLETLTRTVDKVRKRYNPKLRLAGVLLGNYDKSAKLDSDIHEMLKTRFGEQLVFQTTIGRSVKHREATVYCRTIFEHVRGTPPSEQFIELVKEMINRGQKSRTGNTSNPLPDNEALGRLAANG